MSSDVMLRLETAAFCLFQGQHLPGGGGGFANCSGFVRTEELQDLMRRDGGRFPLSLQTQPKHSRHCRSPAGGGPRGPF